MRKHPDIAAIKPCYREFTSVAVTHAGAIPNHQHRDYEFIYVEKGEYHSVLNDYPFILRRGGSMLVKPGDMHSDSFPRHSLLYHGLSFYVEVENSGRPFALFRPEVAPARQINIIPPAAAATAFKRLANEQQKRDHFTTRICQALTADLFWTVVRHLSDDVKAPEFAAEPSANTVFMETLYHVFNEYKFDNAIRVQEIAERMYMSVRQLERRCQAVFNLSPLQIFLRYRLQLAASLLRQTKMSCKEVSAYLGFSNPFHFSIAFKRVMGQSPQRCKEGADPHGPRTISADS